MKIMSEKNAVRWEKAREKGKYFWITQTAFIWSIQFFYLNNLLGWFLEFWAVACASIRGVWPELLVRRRSKSNRSARRANGRLSRNAHFTDRGPRTMIRTL